MKLSYVSAGAALLLVAGAPASARPGDQARDGARDFTRAEALQRAEAMFARLDGNRDGRVTPEEARAAREQRRQARIARRFEQLDANRDGAVTLEEMQRAAGERRDRRAARRMADGGGRMHQRIFGDQGYVTAEQFRARAAERFARMDTDGNGIVSVDESRAARAAMRERMRERRLTR